MGVSFVYLSAIVLEDKTVLAKPLCLNMVIYRMNRLNAFAEVARVMEIDGIYL